VDSAPVMEKIWAEAAGLGWQGKHTNLISAKIGSWFFLGEILVNVDLVPDQPVPDRCGTCEACLTACPTQAIIKPYLLDASRCISYLTIENKLDRLPSAYARQADNWIFGCDICQEVCPWNRFSKSTDEIEYKSSLHSGQMTFTYLLGLDETEFKQVFKASPVLRTGYKNFIRNVQNAKENR
jgi:epoxyqueuosine reductase